MTDVVYDTNRTRDPFKDISATELAEMRGYVCEICNKRRGTQRHHGLVRRNKRYKKQLDVLINYQLACHTCHTETCEADSKENHINFYRIQCNRYGKEVVDNWIKSLPYKIPPDVQRADIRPSNDG